jgi:hypothetical protein
MRRMSTKPGAQDGAVPPAAAADAAGNAEAGNAEAGNAEVSPPASPEQIYEQATARLAVIIDEWQKARDACLRE